MYLSVVITAHNEAGNLALLGAKIQQALVGLDYEFIFVDDGSTDQTLAELEKIRTPRTRLIQITTRQGKAAALYRGLHAASAEFTATLDADLQDEPADIPRMLPLLHQGFDFVSGWRVIRQDSASKRMASAFGNWVNNRMLKVGLHDNNCPLRVFRSICIRRIKYFDTYHRFLPVLVQRQGYRIGEQPVQHYRRHSGRSKYGNMDRIVGNLRTLMVVYFNHNILLKR